MSVGKRQAVEGGEVTAGKPTFTQKWGDDPFTQMGHTQVPNALVEYAARLNLRSEECWLICCILRFKYDAGNPCPSQQRLAQLFGQSVDTVQRTAKKIVAKKLLKIEHARGDRGTFTHTVYDFTPLRFALNECYYQDHPQERPQTPQVGKPAVPQICGTDQAADSRPGLLEEPCRRSAARTRPQICGTNKNLLFQESMQENNSSKKPTRSSGSTPSAPDPAAAELIAALVKEGVNRADALRLARADPHECRRQLDFLPFIADFKSTKGAYLRSAIEQGFGPPKDYLNAQKQQDKAAKYAKETRAEQAERARRSFERRAIEAAKAKLMRDETLWAKIRAQAEAKLPAPLRGKPNHVAYRPALEAKIDEIVTALEAT